MALCSAARTLQRRREVEKDRGKEIGLLYLASPGKSESVAPSMDSEGWPMFTTALYQFVGFTGVLRICSALYLLRPCAHDHCEPVTATLSGSLRIDYPGPPSVLRMRAGGGDLFHNDWQACQKMIQRNSSGPPFFSRLVSFLQVRVVANKTVNLVRFEYTLITFLAQDFVPAADAFQLRIVWQLYHMPAVGF